MSLRYSYMIRGGVEHEDAIAETTTVDCSVEPSRTKQAFAQEADINFIMERYTQTGVLPVIDLGVSQPMFGDFSDGLTFMDALERVREAEESFGMLPARVRDRFQNDPAAFLDFVSQDGNRGEAIKLGLLDDKRAQEPRSARDRASDVRAREIEAAEARGAARAKPAKSTVKT